jgi:hypothetical protein
MSFRTLNKTEKTSTNPAVKFLEWKSEKKCFQYYDKEKAENVEVHLPLKIQFLEDFHTIRGFSDSESTGIYSNEIKFTSKDVLNVKTFSGKEIASGLYNDIRLNIIDAGGKYHKSIYCILNGEIVNISIKGSVVSAFSLFSSGDKKMNIQGNSNRFESHFIEINDFKEMKKGATKYTVPNFTIGKSYSKKDLEIAKDNYSVIVEYFKKDTNNITVVDAEEVSPEVEF